MDKPSRSPPEGKDDAAPPKEMPKFGSTATFGSAPLAFGGSSFGRPAGSSFFNIAPSFGSAAPVFPSFLKLSSESTERPKSPPRSTAEPTPAAPKAPPSLDFFSSTTTSITFNMPKFQWGQPTAPAAQTTAATTSTLFGVNPEKPSTLPEKKEKEEEEDEEEGGEVEQPPSPPQTFTTTPITRPAEPITTGEEDEVHVHQVKAKLYRLDKDEARTFWKERGVGQVRINRSRDEPHDSRIVMRMDGAYKLILNSKIFPTMPARLVGENSVAISALSDESGDSKLALCNFLIKVQGRTEAELLLGAIEAQKQKAAEAPAEPREKTAHKRSADDGAEKKEGQAAREAAEGEAKARSPAKEAHEAAKKPRRRSEEAKGDKGEKEASAPAKERE